MYEEPIIAKADAKGAENKQSERGEDYSAPGKETRQERKKCGQMIPDDAHSVGPRDSPVCRRAR